MDGELRGEGGTYPSDLSFERKEGRRKEKKNKNVRGE